MNNPIRAAIQRFVEVPRLLSLGGSLDGCTALEIGCGRGVGAQLIPGHFGVASLDAFDLDLRMVSRARSRLQNRGNKVMNRLLVGLCGLALLGPGTLESQSQWCGYEPRTLSEVVQAAIDAMPGAEFAYAAYQKPTRAWVRYAGRERAIADTLRTYLVSYFQFLQQDPGFDQLYQREFLFHEGSVEYWMPVQETMVPQLTSELEHDDSTEAFALWAGAYRSGQEWKWVFLLREFSSAATADFWRAELAKCIVPGTIPLAVSADSVAPDAWVRQTPARGMSRDELTALVDTLIVAPDTVFLNVGQTYPLINLSITALDSSGNVVNGILPSFTVRNTDAVVYERLVMRGVEPGVSQLEVLAGSVRDQEENRRAATTVVVVVRP